MPHDGPDHTEPPGDIALRVKALESLLIEKGLVDAQALDEIIDTYQTKVGPQRGAKVVARAWVDADFKAHLLSDATQAIVAMGYEGRQGEHMRVVKNTDHIHNLV
ncbi:MAG TPA: nitrile hydratase subunit alpha, partial [Rhodospirillales bacterium]|nr:nitrile hydratase subunit alpha [Rhodospirillales bacterium]